MKKIMSLLIILAITATSLSLSAFAVENCYEKPKVSVIIPVYNTESYIAQCLDSMINQTLKETEIICVDDGSTDNAINILREYERKDSRIKVIAQENKGAGAARNAAIEIAKGKYFVFVDADDYAEPDYLELMYNKIISQDSDICVCSAAREDVKSNRFFIEKRLLDLSLAPKKDVFSHKDDPKNFLQFTNTVAWNKMFKRELILKNNLRFQEIERCNDYFFVYACLIKADKITIVDKVLYTQRINHGINLHSALYRSPFCFLEASSKLYNWMIDQGLYEELQSSFIKSFIRLSDYNVLRCKDHKDLYIKMFNIVKQKFEEYKVSVFLDELQDDTLKRIANIFIKQTAEQRYQKVMQIYKNKI